MRSESAGGSANAGRGPGDSSVAWLGIWASGAASATPRRARRPVGAAASAASAGRSASAGGSANAEAGA
ncbi:hypothetical protein AB0K89_00005, partial [Streptomyces cinnamoneus]|uniref:hypothetical protein n=1 Tax=Streptomyces cinnamoneus TaxID=53446 RepID=UPI00343179C3